MRIRNGTELLALCGEKGQKISDVMIFYEAENTGVAYQDVIQRMTQDFRVMCLSAKKAFTDGENLSCKIIENDGKKLWDHYNNGLSLVSPMLTKAMCYALSTMTVNASMGKIVAAPTAGSCGVIPGVLLSLMEERKIEEGKIVRGLFTAGAVGLLIAENATLAGSLGGCQAEIGSACAMAAAAVCEVMDAKPQASLNAAALALKSMMGLVCDPVAGLVEAPCAKRNASAVMTAFGCAEMALAGVTSVIPFDEVVFAAADVGRNLPCSLKETSRGGVAITPTALRLQREIFEK